MSGEVELRGLTKRFDDAVAVDGINALIHAGEFFSLLGPSGCGKTTTLRMIAGFERPTAGEILLDGVDVAHVPPHRRNVHTVFQNYALFPHLNVFDNIAFGLRRRRVAKPEVARRVDEVVELVELSGLAARRPQQLSGGQQQRVALARALVLRPALLLLDEPLGALDAKIRKQLRIELKALQEEVGITFVFVTHDQEEALSMSDRVAVMSNGRIEQVGTPATVYEDPGTVFVADFLGVSNLMDADAVDGGAGGSGGCTVAIGEFTLRAGCGDLSARGPVKVVARPERLQLLAHGVQEPNCLPGMVERTVYVGASLQVMIRLATGAQLQASVANTGSGAAYEQGTPIAVHVPVDALRVLGASAAAPADPEAATDPEAAANPEVPANPEAAGPHAAGAQAAGPHAAGPHAAAPDAQRAPGERDPDPRLA